VCYLNNACKDKVKRLILFTLSRDSIVASDWLMAAEEN
jgi:hypothetical protein